MGTLKKINLKKKLKEREREKGKGGFCLVWNLGM
jgi:hypothetical protein